MAIKRRMPFCLFNLIVLTYFNFHKSVRWFERSRSNRIVHSHCIASLPHWIYYDQVHYESRTTLTLTRIIIYECVSTDHLTAVHDSQTRLVTISSVFPAYSFAHLFLSFLYIFYTNPLLNCFSTIFHCDNFWSLF